MYLSKYHPENITNTSGKLYLSNIRSIHFYRHILAWLNNTQLQTYGIFITLLKIVTLKKLYDLMRCFDVIFLSNVNSIHYFFKTCSINTHYILFYMDHSPAPSIKTELCHIAVSILDILHLA